MGPCPVLVLAFDVTLRLELFESATRHMMPGKHV